jgi:hypothetical protein
MAQFPPVSGGKEKRVWGYLIYNSDFIHVNFNLLYQELHKCPFQLPVCCSQIRANLLYETV